MLQVNCASGVRFKAHCSNRSPSQTSRRSAQSPSTPRKRELASCSRTLSLPKHCPECLAAGGMLPPLQHLYPREDQDCLECAERNTSELSPNPEPPQRTVTARGRHCSTLRMIPRRCPVARAVPSPAANCALTATSCHMGCPGLEFKSNSLNKVIRWRKVVNYSGSGQGKAASEKDGWWLIYQNGT